MLQGVEKMHSVGVVHRDLKPANIMLSQGYETNKCKAFIADLGESCTVIGSVEGVAVCPKKSVVGTVGYIAPETSNYGRAGLKNDVWASGLILYELFFGALPEVILYCQKKYIHKEYSQEKEL